MRPSFIQLLTADAMSQQSCMATTMIDHNMSLRSAMYRDDGWAGLTGKSVADLWREFVSTLIIP
jgi:hypothetical protein